MINSSRPISGCQGKNRGFRFRSIDWFSWTCFLHVYFFPFKPRGFTCDFSHQRCSIQASMIVFQRSSLACRWLHGYLAAMTHANGWKIMGNNTRIITDGCSQLQGMIRWDHDPIFRGKSPPMGREKWYLQISTNPPWIHLEVPVSPKRCEDLNWSGQFTINRTSWPRR